MFDRIDMGASSSYCGYPISLIEAKNRLKVSPSSRVFTDIVNSYANLCGLDSLGDSPEAAMMSMTVLCTTPEGVHMLYGMHMARILSAGKQEGLLLVPAVEWSLYNDTTPLATLDATAKASSVATQLVNALKLVAANMKVPLMEREPWTSVRKDAVAWDNFLRGGMLLMEPVCPCALLTLTYSIIKGPLGKVPVVRAAVLDTFRSLVRPESPWSWDVMTNGVACSDALSSFSDLKSLFLSKDACIVAVLSRLCVSSPVDNKARYGVQKDIGVYSVLLVMDTDVHELAALKGPALMKFIESSGKVKVGTIPLQFFLSVPMFR